MSQDETVTQGSTADQGSDTTRGDLRVTSITAMRLVHPQVSDPYRILDVRPLVLGREPGPDQWAVADERVSRRHASIEPTPDGHWRLRDLRSHNGVYVNGRKTDGTRLADGDVIRLGRTFVVFVRGHLPAGCRLPRLGGERGLARAIVDVTGDIAARSSLPILITGETGVGKERLARRLHAQSGREGAFVAINCGALSAELLASELFGHVRGAFSGAHSHRSGLFVSAHRGTILLDEIGEMPLTQQPALLRVLQEKRVRPVGADSETEVDVRIIAATHLDMTASVQAGLFRADLLARLRGITLRLPPLRQRRDEIIGIFQGFVGDLPFGPSVVEALLGHEWPENVRELEHVAAHARLFGENVGRIHLSHLPEDFRRAAELRVEQGPLDRGGRGTARPSDDALRSLLETHRGNISRIARALNVQRLQVYRWVDKAGLDVDAYRGGPKPGK